MRFLRAAVHECDVGADVFELARGERYARHVHASAHGRSVRHAREMRGVARFVALLGIAVLESTIAGAAHAQRTESSVVAVRARVAEIERRGTGSGAADDVPATGLPSEMYRVANAGDVNRGCRAAGDADAIDPGLDSMSRLQPCFVRDTTDAARSWFTPLRHMPLWATPIASALVPGLGQFRLHQDRFVAYMAAEAFAVLQFAKDRREGRDNAVAYRAIARDIARRGFVASPPDTIWQYYEKLEKFIESGAFTLSVNGPTVPETDPSTYNGFLWQQARMVFGVPLDDPGAVGSPRYQQALARYEETAVRQPYRWSWRNAQLEQDLFRRSIARSNDAYRRATTDLGVLIANHLLSSVDAFATVRLLQAGPGSYRVSAAIPVK